MSTGEKDSNTLPVDAYYLEYGGKLKTSVFKRSGYVHVWTGPKISFFSRGHTIIIFLISRFYEYFVTFRGEHQSTTKLVEALHPNGLSDGSLTSTGENKAFPPSSLPCNVLPLFGLPIKNGKKLRKKWRWDCFVLCSYPIEYNVSTILSPIDYFPS